MKTLIRLQSDLDLRGLQVHLHLFDALLVLLSNTKLCNFQDNYGNYFWCPNFQNFYGNCIGVSNHRGAPVAQWVKRWPTELAVVSSSPAGGEILSTVNGVLLHTAFHYQPLIVLI